MSCTFCAWRSSICRDCPLLSTLGLASPFTEQRRYPGVCFTNANPPIQSPHVHLPPPLSGSPAQGHWPLLQSPGPGPRQLRTALCHRVLTILKPVNPKPAHLHHSLLPTEITTRLLPSVPALPLPPDLARSYPMGPCLLFLGIWEDHKPPFQWQPSPVC